VKIITKYNPPPFTDRNYDWSATVEGSGEKDPVGFGATEQEAIEDLKTALESQ
jgi:hypothetical protein